MKQASEKKSGLFLAGGWALAYHSLDQAHVCDGWQAREART